MDIVMYGIMWHCRVIFGVLINILSCNIATGENTIHACLNDYVSLECSETQDCTINITQAQFGHPTLVSDSCNALQRPCYTNATDVWRHCHDRAACSFYVHEARANDVNGCKFPSLNLEIKYECHCAESCEALPLVDNGLVQYSNPYLTRGTVASFRCDAGFKLVGPSSRTCQPPGVWSDIQPACSIPDRVCPQLDFSSQTFGYSCYELVEKSRNWSMAQADCNMKNSTLLTLQDETEMEFITWWLENTGIFGYVWGSEIDNNTNDGPVVSNYPYQCPEFLQSTPGTADAGSGSSWYSGMAPCSSNNKYICEYVIANYVPDNEDVVILRKKDLTLWLGVGCGILIVVVLLIITAVCYKKRHQQTCKDCSKGCDDYDSVGDPEMASTTTFNTSSSPPGAISRTYNTAEKSTGSSNDGFSSGSVENGLPESPSSSHVDDVTLYDDVYIAGNGGRPGSGRPKLPRRVQRGSHKRGAHRNVYENVLLHNLTESLKRKFLPKRLSNRFRRSTENSVSKGNQVEESSPRPRSNIRKGKYVNQSNGVNAGVNSVDVVHEQDERSDSVASTETVEASFDLTEAGSSGSSLHNSEKADDSHETNALRYRESDSLEIFENELYVSNVIIDEDRTEL